LPTANVSRRGVRLPVKSESSLRPIECGHRINRVREPSSFSYSRCVGRVGALALALGIGSGFAAMPMAFADTTGSAGATGAGPAGASGRSDSSASPRTQSPARMSRSGSQTSPSMPSTPSTEVVRARGNRSGGDSASTAAPRRQNSTPAVTADIPVDTSTTLPGSRAAGSPVTPENPENPALPVVAPAAADVPRASEADETPVPAPGAVRESLAVAGPAAAAAAAAVVAGVRKRGRLAGGGPAGLGGAGSVPS